MLVAPSAVHPQTGSVNLPAELSQAEQLGIRFELIDIREVGEVEAAFDAAVRGLIRMRVEMLDRSGKVVAQHIGWAYGNVPPGGRAYFMIPIPPQSPPERRVTVESFVLQAYEAQPQSP